MHPKSLALLICASCDMPQSTWTARAGRGYKKNDELFCCRGCAEGSGCLCAENPIKAISKQKVARFERFP